MTRAFTKKQYLNLLSEQQQEALERSTSTLVVKRIKEGGTSSIGSSIFYLKDFPTAQAICSLPSLHAHWASSIGIFAPKKAKNCTCILRNLPLKMKKKIGIFWVLVTSDHCDTQSIVHSLVSFVIPRKISERRDLAAQNQSFLQGQQTIVQKLALRLPLLVENGDKAKGRKLLQLFLIKFSSRHR